MNSKYGCWFRTLIPSENKHQLDRVGTGTIEFEASEDSIFEKLAEHLVLVSRRLGSRKMISVTAIFKFDERGQRISLPYTAPIRWGFDVFLEELRRQKKPTLRNKSR